LLLFVLKQLAKEQITFFRSRYRSEPDVIEIQEDELTDRVSYILYLWHTLTLEKLLRCCTMPTTLVNYCAKR